MIGPELLARIRQLFYAEHWKIGTIAAELDLHHDTVERALCTERFHPVRVERERLTDPYVPFIRETLDKHPRLRATRLYEMIRARGYAGSANQLRRLVRDLRPVGREAFLKLRVFPGEQGQVDWASFGEVQIGRARRKLSCFVLTLSHSRALALEFCFDQKLETFLRAHVRAFTWLGGCPFTPLPLYPFIMIPTCRPTSRSSETCSSPWCWACWSASSESGPIGTSPGFGLSP